MHLYKVFLYTIEESWEMDSHHEDTWLIVAESDEAADEKVRTLNGATEYDAYIIERIEEVEGYKIELTK